MLYINMIYKGCCYMFFFCIVTVIVSVMGFICLVISPDNLVQLKLPAGREVHSSLRVVIL